MINTDLKKRIDELSKEYNITDVNELYHRFNLIQVLYVERQHPNHTPSQVREETLERLKTYLQLRKNMTQNVGEIKNETTNKYNKNR